jgi:hypothetical protein
VVATLEAEMKVAMALDPVVVWRIVDRYGWVRRPSFRSRRKVSRVVLCQEEVFRSLRGVQRAGAVARWVGVCGGLRETVQEVPVSGA